MFFAIPFTVFSQNDYVGSGRAISFDGIDDYIDLGDIFDDVALPVTISAWVFVEPNNNIIQYPIFTSQDNLLTYNGFTFVTSTLPHIGFTIGDGRGGNNAIYRRSRAGYYNAVGQWVYLTAVARSGQDIHTYLNGHELSGEYQGSSSYPMDSYSPDQVAKIGYLFSNNFSYWFDGIMDELRIWNRDLSQDEIRQTMCRRLKGDEPDLIGYWNFDETAGDVLKDLSPNGHDGILKGNPERVYSGAPVGDESVFLYTSTWTGKSLAKDDMVVSNISSDAYGVHIYAVHHIPSQTGGLDVANIQTPYHGVFIADDGQANTFDLSFTGNNVCSYHERTDNSEPAWNATDIFSGISQRIEIIPAYESSDLQVSLGDDITVCDESSYFLETNTDPTGKIFRWSSGDTTPAITVTSSGTYAVEVKEGCLVDKDTVAITFLNSPRNFSLGEDELLCEMEPRTLSTDPVNMSYTLTWQDGSGDESFPATDFGTYWLKVQNACGSASDTITFTQIIEPDVDVFLGEDVIFCEDLPFFLLAHPQPDGKTFQWNTGDTTPGISVNVSGIYTVEVTDKCSSDRDTISISYLSPPPAFSLGEDETWCALGPDRTLSFEAGSNHFDFTWHNGSKANTVPVTDFGTYWLKVENECGSAVDSVTFTQKDFRDVIRYNFISPDNQDALNQHFSLDARLTGSQVAVFNRWGKLVYQSADYQNNWDGNELPAGVYYYTVTGECFEPLKGTLTIMR